MRIFKTGEYSNKRRHSCKKMVLSAGMALMLAAAPVTAMAGQVYGSNTGVTSANSVMNNIAAGLSMSIKIDMLYCININTQIILYGYCYK